ncbi:MAG: hypothetical protein QGI53_09435, partial [SAR324 cluster bacterium]|nr:hypothetical protein [SAR324 cluster bacterium]
MTATDFAQYNLLSSLQNSGLLDSTGESKTWFGLLNLSDYPVDEFPDAGQIADYIFAELELPEIQIFLLLIERKQKEPWTENTASVHFQQLCEIKIQKTNHYQQNTELIKRGCVWKDRLSTQNLQEILTQNPDA